MSKDDVEEPLKRLRAEIAEPQREGDVLRRGHRVRRPLGERPVEWWGFGGDRSGSERVRATGEIFGVTAKHSPKGIPPMAKSCVCPLRAAGGVPHR